MVRFYSCLCMTVACAIPAYAKPIAFADGTTAMLEHGAGTMQEIQIFYAPRFNYSIGGGHLDLDSDIDYKTRHITYARINWLAHRWNQASAQANLFVWGGLGGICPRVTGYGYIREGPARLPMLILPIRPAICKKGGDYCSDPLTTTEEGADE